MAEGEEVGPEERGAPVVSHLVDKDAVPFLGTGMALLGVLVVMGLLVHGGMPWTVPPSDGDEDGPRMVLLALLGGTLLAWTLIGYGLLITAAKVGDIREMLRAQRPSSRSPEGPPGTS